MGGVTGLAATGAGAAGLGAAIGFAAVMGLAAAMGFAAAAGLRAGALRAAGLRAAGFRAAGLRAVVLRAAGFRAVLLEVLRAEVLRAVARFAVVLRAVVLRAVLRTARPVLRAVLRTVRATFLAVLRGVVFLLVVRFFPLVFVAMASAPILLCCRTPPLKRTRRCTNHAPLVQAYRPTRRVNCFFHYTTIASESANSALRSAQASAPRISSIPRRWRKSGSTKRALTRPSLPITSVAGMGKSHPP